MMKQKIPNQALDKEAVRKILPFNLKSEVIKKIKLKFFNYSQIIAFLTKIIKSLNSKELRLEMHFT